MLPFYLLFVSLVAADEIFGNIYASLDNSVSPCDNFYDHVCNGQLNTFNRLDASMARKLQASINKYVSKEYYELTNSIRVDLEFAKGNDQTDMEFVKLLKAKCNVPGSDGLVFYREQLTKYNADLMANIDWQNMDCANKAIITVLLLKLVDVTSAYDGAMGNLRKMSTVGSWEGFVQDENNGYALRMDTLEELFQTMKGNLMESLENSAFLESTNRTEYAQIEMAKTHLAEWTLWGLNEQFGGLLENYTDCIENKIIGVRASEVQLCVLSISSEILSDFGSGMSFLSMMMDFAIGIGEEPLLSRYSSGFDPASYSIIILPVVMGLVESEDRLAVLSTMGTILAHEVSHSIFQDERTEMQIPCLMENMEQTCVQLTNKGKSCYSGGATFSEDTPDWLGLHTVLRVVDGNDTLADQTKEIAPGQLLTADQMVFYNYASQFCRYQDTMSQGNPHSPSSIRTNGILRLFPQFKQAFNCQNGDFMVYQNQDQCVLAN